MASIVERSTGSGERRLYVVFHAIDRDTGKPRKVWERVAGGKKEANTRKAQIEVALVKSGRHWPAEPKPVPVDAPPTFEAYAWAWLESYARPSLRRRVFSSYETNVRLHLIPHFADTPLPAVTRSQVKSLVAQKLADGKARGTIRNILVPLAEMLSHAVEDGLLVANPAANMRIPAQAEVRKVEPPPREHVEATIAAAGDDCRDALTLAASLGLRRGELFALRWKDIDREANVIRVRASNHAGVIEEQTKTKAGDRLVPLFASARRVLAARELRSRPFNRPQDLVFCTRVGTAIDPGNFVRREFSAALERAGLGNWVQQGRGRRRWEGAFTWHALRHYAVSELIAQRADIKLLQSIAGHASATMTLDRYGHLMAERVSEAADLYDPLRAAAGSRVNQ